MTGIGGIGAYQATSALTGIARYRETATKTETAALSTGGVATPTDQTDISPAGKVLEKAARDNPAASDPFRAYRDENGNISMKEIMKIEALPPKLRTAAKLTAEAKSLNKDINAAQKEVPPDQKKIDGLQAELAGTMAKLTEELKKLGLLDKMGEDGVTVDDIVSGGIGKLSDLAKEYGIADDETETAAKVAKKSKNGENSMSTAITTGFAAALASLSGLLGGASNSNTTDGKNTTVSTLR